MHQALVGFTGADKGAGEPLPLRSYLERFQHHKMWFNFAQVFSVVLEGKGVVFRDVPQCFRFSIDLLWSNLFPSLDSKNLSLKQYHVIYYCYYV